MGIKSIESRVADIETALSHMDERSSDMATAFFRSQDFDKISLPAEPTDLASAITLLTWIRRALIKNEICDGQVPLS